MIFSFQGNEDTALALDPAVDDHRSKQSGYCCFALIQSALNGSSNQLSCPGKEHFFCFQPIIEKTTALTRQLIGFMAFTSNNHNVPRRGAANCRFDGNFPIPNDDIAPLRDVFC